MRNHSGALDWYDLFTAMDMLNDRFSELEGENP